MNDPHEYDNWQPSDGLSKYDVSICPYCKALVMYKDKPDHLSWHKALRAALWRPNPIEGE